MLTRYFTPFNDFRTLQSRVFEPFFGRFNFLEDELPSGTWAPAVDVAEEVDKILVKVEVPGKDERSYHRIERAYGTFTRTFSLPRTVDASAITANYRNGILEIEIPKKEEAKPKQIAINVGTKEIDG